MVFGNLGQPGSLAMSLVEEACRAGVGSAMALSLMVNPVVVMTLNGKHAMSILVQVCIKYIR